MKLRLLLFKDCNRKCPGCCNKDWDLDNLPICNSFKEYEEIILTGGEPMLKPDLILKVIDKIKEENPTAKIIMYTAFLNSPKLIEIVNKLDGITFTLHEQKDVNIALKNLIILNHRYSKKSLRLNVFKNINLKGITLNNWKIKDNIVWIKNCPLPKGEILMKLKKEDK